MDKQTLSNYGWLVIVTLILAVMLAFATPFGTYVGDGVVSIANGFVGASDQAIDEDNIKTNGEKWDSKFDYSGFDNNSGAPKCCESPNVKTYVDDTKCLSCNNVVYGSDIHSGIIPENATYYVNNTSTTLGDYSGATETYTYGDKFPDTVNIGDVYVYGDYEYRYNKRYDGATNVWSDYSSQNGWGVRVLNASKTSYGNVLETINNKPITSLYRAFMSTSITSTDFLTIPDTVTNIEGMFMICRNLTDISTLNISNNITSLAYLFDRCSSLKDASVLNIPNSVTNMHFAFISCSQLTSAPILPNNLTQLNQAFSQCTKLNLPNGYVIPSTVIETSLCFYKCTSLTNAPVIPENVKYFSQTFDGCTSLSGSITINANPTSYGDALQGTKITEILGNTTLKTEILATK